MLTLSYDLGNQRALFFNRMLGRDVQVTLEALGVESRFVLFVASWLTLFSRCA